MATKRLRHGAWHYTVRRSGLLDKPIYLSFQDEADGDRYVAQLEALLDKGIVPDEFQRAPKLKRLSAIIDAYLTAYHVSQSDRVILTRLSASPEARVSALDYAWAEAHVAAMKAAGRVPVTIRHRVGALARCLDWAVRRGDLASNPLRLLMKGYSIYADGSVTDAERDRRIEPGEEEAIRRVLAGGVRPEGKQRALVLEHREALVLMFDLSLETAMRMREVYTLEVSQIDLARRTIFLDKTKNGHKRQVPLSSVAVAALQGYPAPESGFLLPFYDGHLGRTTGRLSRLWGRVFDHAGCPDLHYHDTRHEAVCRLYERTSLSDLEIAKITGHRSLKMLMRYANLRGSSLADKLWALAIAVSVPHWMTGMDWAAPLL